MILKKAYFLSLLICFSLITKSNQEMKVVNNTDQQLNVGLTVPERTAAIIQFSKINNEPIAPKEDPKILLMRAITNDSAEEVINAVNAGASLKQLQPGKSPLLIAVLLKKGNAVRALLECGAEATKEMVQYSIDLGNIQNAIILTLKGKLNLNECYKNGDKAPPLFWIAINYGDFENALILLQNGAYLAGQDHPISPMHTIIRTMQQNDIHAINLIKEMVAKGYNVNNVWKRERWPNEEIYKKGILELFISLGADPNHIININLPDRISGNIWTWTPFFKAIEIGNLSAVKFLIDHGANINQKANPISHLKDFTPLSFALYKGQSEIVELLVIHGANL